MYNLIAKSKIVLNYHIDSGKGNNMRVFETTGVQTCLFTNGKYSLEKYFDCEKDIVCFNNLEDAKEKLKNLINNEETIKQISKNGQIATLTKNTFRNRKIIFSKVFLNILKFK
jgi:spore maturation protein CgeB